MAGMSQTLQPTVITFVIQCFCPPIVTMHGRTLETRNHVAVVVLLLLAGHWEDFCQVVG